MSLNQTTSPLVALTIAGFDPSGGAGVVADIKTFTSFGCFATAAVTSLTFQNTTGVFGAVHQTAEAVRAQVLPVVEDFHVAGLKTGMLPTREVISEVARLLRECALPAPVVDPVVRSTSGFDLIDDAALDALKTELLPLARVVTPNIPEAERITGLKSITDAEGMRRAARVMREMGARAVLIKGGHLKGEAIDLLDDDGRVILFRGPRIHSKATHGTGCTLAAAIAACLARGMNLEESVGAGKSFVADAIRHAPHIGRGHSPVNHNVPLRFDAWQAEQEREDL
ncbi:MAG TPA: bifunctional hydroxymethylpyrimidine kinase/phosphomethylpyrimidine kinase [Pyrinomonadaceae bacterium]|jgi:hydroxymethylpyrimidine kinase/phosphomethylpyrimidine kinase|nr:bifunctional hydroxymethylpyrimidine kinase/phosphomethylpyrimidine kinase [Pyrinomonadaceae bacterium]